MPIYEYHCDACDVTFERIRRASDETPVECPECREEARKLLSTFAARGDASGSGGYSAPSRAPSCSPGGG
jgi:putative FmdB family regulatory protein